MGGWSWEYAEQTVTAARLDAIVRATKPAKEKARRVSLEEFRAMHPNGLNANG